MLFLGCDGGSTKFAYIICDERGNCLLHKRFRGVNIVADGMAGYVDAVHDHMAQVLEAARISASALTHCAYGVSGYGESRTAAEEMTAAVIATLGHSRCTVCNDSVIGWSGALALQPGISVAAGTGSVAYGVNTTGRGERAGGWSVRFGDEGSAYWIAVRAADLFYRQADGRLPKSMLFGHFMRLFNLKDPLHFAFAFEETYGSSPAETASFQKEVLSLYHLGDTQVQALYSQAAHELAQLVKALMQRLAFAIGPPVPVSYSGGLFQAGACILTPFTEAVQQLGASVVKPLYNPLIGAVGYAAKGILSEIGRAHV